MNKLLILLGLLIMAACSKHEIKHTGGLEHRIEISIDFGLISEIRKLCEVSLADSVTNGEIKRVKQSDVVNCVLDNLSLFDINFDVLYDFIDNVCDTDEMVSFWSECQSLTFGGELL